MTAAIHLNSPALWFLVAIGVIFVIATTVSLRQVRCIRCGRHCAGRRAGGTIDQPLCLTCAEDDNRGLEFRPR